MDPTTAPTVASPREGIPSPSSANGSLVRFACRLMLILNLLLTGFFCFLALTSYQDFANVEMPAWMKAVLSIPPTALAANAGGVAAVLVLLEFVAPGRKATLIANALSLIVLVLAIIVVESSLRLPWFLLFAQLQRQ